MKSVKGYREMYEALEIEPCLDPLHSSGYAGGAAQISQVNAINDNDKSFTIQPHTSMILHSWGRVT